MAKRIKSEMRRSRNKIEQLTYDDVVTGSAGKKDDFKNRVKPNKIYKKNPITGMLEKEDIGIIDENGEQLKDTVINSDIGTYLKMERDHNEKVLNKMDPRFSEDFQVQGDNILVRLLQEKLYKTSSGLWKAIPQIAVVKPSGQGYEYKQKNYPFTNAGRVVNISNQTSENTGIMQGDIVILKREVVSEQPLPGTGTTYLPNEFTHYDRSSMTVHDEYGYVMISSYHIIGKRDVERFRKQFLD